MIYIHILLIIIILLIDFYFTSSVRLGNTTDSLTNSLTNSLMSTDNLVEFAEPNPWSKIHKGKINKYYIKINNIANYVDNIITWKKLPYINDSILDIDIADNFLIIKSSSEEEALVLCNLIISNLNDDITLDNIISNNLINTTTIKAKKYKLISMKLKELIKEGLSQLNNTEQVFESFDTNMINNTIPHKQEPVVNKLVDESIKTAIPFDMHMSVSKIVPYEGNEYAMINF